MKIGNSHCRSEADYGAASTILDMSITALVFPFDLYGSPGTRAGAELLGDALREIRTDAKSESRDCRSKAYRDQLKILEAPFEIPSHYRLWEKRGKKLFDKSRDSFPIWLSGNHLGVMPIYQCLPIDTLVLQFDAHLDVFNLDDCTEELSNGNFIMHARPLPKIVNIGHRDLFLPDDHIHQYYNDCLPATDWGLNADESLKKLRKILLTSKQIWIDIDCDVFDPAFMPGVAQPEPMGLSPLLVMGILEALWSKKIIGFSLSEFAPQRDRNDQTLATLCWLLEWVLLKSA